MKVLAIETSCDETAASVAEKSGIGIKILSNVVSSQIDIHKKYGGVVPEIAAREHVVEILPVIDEALTLAGIRQADLIKKKSVLDAIAVTIGPGLMSSLQTGVETAKSLAYVWDLPIIGVHHIIGHIYANFIDLKQNIHFPAVVLTVSGGHTNLLLMKNWYDFELLGDTRDDAAGEAFDKAAKLMNLDYPGGPAIAQRADQFELSLKKNKLTLPRPMLQSNDLDFSFSGLKTALRYQLEKDGNWHNRVNEYCYEFQEAVAEVLVSKTIKAAQQYQVKTIMLAGGVSANLRLRQVLEQQSKHILPQVHFLKPLLPYTTDNAAMIASAGVFYTQKQLFTSWQNLQANCNLSI